MSVVKDPGRVLITGIGLISPIGVGLSTFWEALLLGRSGIDRITRFDPTSYPCQIGGEVRDLSYETLLDPRKLKMTTHATQLALAATELALRDAGLEPRNLPPDTVGVSMGTALGGWREAEQQSAIIRERGARRVNPFVANGAANHALGVEVAGATGAQGTQKTSSIGCAASAQAIGEAAALVATGDLEVCLAGGAESPITPLVFAGLSRTLELCSRNEEPAKASRPFDRGHSGMVLSEGSCMLVLESADSARSRGATAYGEVIGFASSCDAQGVFSVDQSGAVGARAVQRALRRADLDPGKVDYICSHANSSVVFDQKETAVLKMAFGAIAGKIPVSSIKGVLGHPFGASGVFQVAATLLAIRHNLIPPTYNLDDPDPSCDLDYVPREPRPKHIDNALVTSYGYGGVNVYLLISRPRD